METNQLYKYINIFINITIEIVGENMKIELIFLFFVLGLIIIIKGGNLFVDGAIWIAHKTGIPSSIIGATIVSVATTLPELFVSSVASNEGYSEMAIGNAIGSIVYNIAFILGICALIKPIKIEDVFFEIKGFMLISYLLIFSYFASDRIVTKGEGGVLLFLFLIFIGLNIFEFREEGTNKKRIKNNSLNRKEVIANLIKFILGTWFIIVGAHILVDTGVKIAKFFKIPKQVISLTLLAMGTSLPELVTSIIAIMKDEINISVGNILGANILNLTIVLGLATLVSDNGLIVLRQTIYLDLPISLIIILFFVFRGIFKKKIDRKTGAIFLIMYLVYLAILF